MSTSLNPTVIDILEQAIDNKIGDRTGTGSSLMSAVVQRVDDDGTGWVSLPGSEQDTPIGYSGIELIPGDTIFLQQAGNKLYALGNTSNPAISSTTLRPLVADIKQTSVVAEAAKQGAIDAQTLAENTSSYFFHDNNGAHVSTKQGEYGKEGSGYSTTIGAADSTTGIILQHDDDILASFTPTALNFYTENQEGELSITAGYTKDGTAFYDGEGNDTSNILAIFGKDLARIGYFEDRHAEVDSSGFHLYKGPVETSFLGENLVYKKLYQDPIGYKSSTFSSSSVFVITKFPAITPPIFALYDSVSDYASRIVEFGNIRSLDVEDKTYILSDVHYNPRTGEVSRPILSDLGELATDDPVLASDLLESFQMIWDDAMAEAAASSEYKLYFASPFRGSWLEYETNNYPYNSLRLGSPEAEEVSIIAKTDNRAYSTIRSIATSIENQSALTIDTNGLVYIASGALASSDMETGLWGMPSLYGGLTSNNIVLASPYEIKLFPGVGSVPLGSSLTMSVENQAILENSMGNSMFWARRTDTNVEVRFGVGTNGTSHGVYSGEQGRWLLNGTESDVYLAGVNYTSVAANRILAAPNGSTGAATFRALVAADIPNLAASKISSGTLALDRLPTVTIAKGGTGATTAAAALKAIMGGKTILYNSTAGTNGNVTLSQTAANFNHMRIYYRGGSASAAKTPDASVDVYSPNKKYVSLRDARYTNSTSSLQYAVVYINGTTISKSNQGYINVSGSNAGAGTLNEIYIYRVEAWNE